MIQIQITYNKELPEELKAAYDAVMRLTGFDKTKLEQVSTITVNTNYTETWELDSKKDFSVNSEWQAGNYLVRNHTVKYNDVVYRIIQSHTAQAGWEPDVSLSLFRMVPIVYPGEQYPRWDSIGLLDSENSWGSGERVTWNGEEWESDVDNNVWEPGVSQWTNLSQPAQTIEAWVQPTGAHDVYNTGDKVTYNSRTWESTVDNNSWEPGVYGWAEI